MVESFADDNLFPDETFKTDFERNSALSSYFYDATVNYYNYWIVHIIVNC